jgi:predicted acylesterase/phospholipase RssA
MTIQYTHLVLSGGGLSGMVYLGALKYLQEEGYDKNILHISGASIGALFATAFTLGVSMDDLEARFKNFFINKELCTFQLSIDVLLYSYDNLGLDDGKKLTVVIEDLIGHMTFLDLSKKTGKNLIISCTHVSSMIPTYFSVDTTPNVLVIEAVRASMAIPLFIRPIEIGEDYYVDGGITDGIPVEPFINIPEKLILILHLSQKHELVPLTPNIKPTFLKLFTTVFENYLSSYLSIRLLTNTYTNYCRFKKCPVSFLPFVWENESIIITVNDNELEESINIGHKRLKTFIEFKNKD